MPQAFTEVVEWLMATMLLPVVTLPVAGLLQLYASVSRLVTFGLWWSPAKKTILLMGASSGIGEEMAVQLAKQGVSKLILCARRSSELERVAERCRSLATEPDFQAHPFSVDVAQPEQVRTLFEDRLPGVLLSHVDAILLNAGLSMSESTLELTPSQAMDILQPMTTVNYQGLVACTLYALPFLRKAPAATGARILVVSSLLGVASGPRRSFYCGSKFALLGFYDALRLELASTPGYKHISVTLAYPGRVATELFRLGTHTLATASRRRNASMTAATAASIVLGALERPWSRDAYFGVRGKVLAALKGVSSDAGDLVVAQFLSKEERKKESCQKND